MYKRIWLQTLSEEGGFIVLDFTWKVFTQTGCIDTYLLFKELEKENGDGTETQDDELAELDFPVS